jgi:hypothetical protein
LALTSGGTGATTSSDALNNLLPSGEQTGYVLKTSGAGTYYWASESGGGGATVGQQLTTLRQSNVATSGQTVFELVNGVEYTPGSGQLRVYIDGVRQFTDAYTETSANTYTLSSGVTAGAVVFAEIDQFSSFNNYANLVYASNIGNIQAEGLTVQAAIENLENNKAPLNHPVFLNDITVNGNIYLGGSSTYVSANNLTLTDSLIYLAESNPTDSVDIGLVGSFNDGTYQHTGLARDATDGTWKLFANVVQEPTTVVDFTDATYSNLRIGGLTATSAAISGAVSATTLTLSSTPLALTSGGTGSSVTSGVGGALDNLLPAGEQTGYVLATSGAGSYYWASPSGSGATVGQSLTTQRQANAIVANTTVINLTGINYTPGSGQLRVYINGVRQFPGAYTETSNVSYTLSANVVSGDTVFSEIDQFSTFNNYANLVYASNVGTISAAGLTVQTAIESLENNKAPTASPTFTGTAAFAAATFNGLTTLTETTEVLDTKSSVTGTVTHDFSTSAIWYYSSMSGAVTANFTNVPTTNNRVISLSIVVNQGATGYLVNAVQIDGAAQTIRWQGNTVPTASTNRLDVFTFSLIRAASTWTVLGAATSHG